MLADGKNKNGVQDLEKIMWYTQHLIDHVKKTQEENDNEATIIYAGNEPAHFVN